MSDVLQISMYLGLASGAVALLYVMATIYSILRMSIPANTENEKRAKEIHSYIYSAAKAYIYAQYRVILAVLSVVTILLLVGGFAARKSELVMIGVTYMLGGISSMVVGIVGMLMAIQSNIRVLNILAKRDLRRALTMAFRGGSITGFLVGGIGLFFISLLFILLRTFYDEPTVMQILLGYAFGASTVALFARVGGGIYTKAADIGADLVGKVEVGIPEDDPRNPGVIADNVGDNVGDCAGMGADLFESYVEAIVAPMVIATLLARPELIAYPMLFSAIALITSIAAAQFVSAPLFTEPGRTLTFTSILAISAAAIVNGVVTLWATPTIMSAWIVGVLGLIVGAVVGFTSDYFTSPLYRPVKIVAANSQFGPALTILSGLSMGFYSVFIPSAAIGLAVVAAASIGSAMGSTLNLGENLLAAVYSAALAGTGMLAVAPIIVSADAYGPIVDNVAGLAEQAGFEEEVRTLADKLDSAGNTMKSISKGYAIGSAALTALGLLFSFASVLAQRMNIKITEVMATIFNAGHEVYGPYFIGGIVLGAVVIPLFVAMIIQAVTAAAGRLVDEIRRQFREKPGILEWKDRPDYERAVRIVTYYALRRLIAPGILAIAFPLVLGTAFAIGDPWRGASVVGGMLVGAIASGLLLGLLQGNVGNTWDNAKKYIEAGNFGGKGTETHKAAVVGDTVGDPLKDASGPAINIMIKVMSVASTVILPYILFA